MFCIEKDSKWYYCSLVHRSINNYAHKINKLILALAKTRDFHALKCMKTLRGILLVYSNKMLHNIYKPQRKILIKKKNKCILYAWQFDNRIAAVYEKY